MWVGFFLEVAGGGRSDETRGLLNNPSCLASGLTEPRFLFFCREIIVRYSGLCYDIFHISIYTDLVILQIAGRTPSFYRTDLNRWPMIGGSPLEPTPGTLLQMGGIMGERVAQITPCAATTSRSPHATQLPFQTLITCCANPDMVMV